jgi:hypothetical protein
MLERWGAVGGHLRWRSDLRAAYRWNMDPVLTPVVVALVAGLAVSAKVQRDSRLKRHFEGRPGYQVERNARMSMQVSRRVDGVWQTAEPMKAGWFVRVTPPGIPFRTRLHASSTDRWGDPLELRRMVVLPGPLAPFRMSADDVALAGGWLKQEAVAVALAQVLRDRSVRLTLEPGGGMRVEDLGISLAPVRLDGLMRDVHALASALRNSPAAQPAPEEPEAAQGPGGGVPLGIPGRNR